MFDSKQLLYVTDMTLFLSGSMLAGSSSPTPKRATHCEAALVGKPWNEETARQAGAFIGEDFAPIDDHRASAAYRVQVAANLFVRLFRDLAGADEIDVVTLDRVTA